MRTLWFVAGYALRWAVVAGIVVGLWNSTIGVGRSWDGWFVVAAIAIAVVRSFSHVRRVQLVTDRTDAATLRCRHRRQIEVPLAADDAFAIVEAAIRELPRVESLEAARDSLQVKARVKRPSPYLSGRPVERSAVRGVRARRNLVFATIAPGADTSSVTLVCEPEGGAWHDWFTVDDGTNLENIEAIARAITRRIAERRRIEQEEVRDTATEKELTVARLSLLHAQVEPHFLYNTLASAQLLTRNDPARADQMLGHLIQYLRSSLPKAGEPMSTVGEEIVRARAYLEILKIRMGERLRFEVDVSTAARTAPIPAMMLQTLVENAVKHGLEPVSTGGTVWISGREADGEVVLTVADDGRGFSDATSGTGIGLKNVRERLRLVYGDAASFAIGANFPRGVSATITIPAQAAVHAPAEDSAEQTR